MTVKRPRKAAGNDSDQLGRIVELVRNVVLILAVLMLPAGTALRDWPACETSTPAERLGRTDSAEVDA